MAQLKAPKRGSQWAPQRAFGRRSNAKQTRKAAIQPRRETPKRQSDSLLGREKRANDALIKRLVTLAEQELGPPPTEYAWIVFGSEGRSEQMLLTDQVDVGLFVPV